MSQGKNKLRELAHLLLTEEECETFKLAMKNFRDDQSVLCFCSLLHSILNSPEKLVILEELYHLIPDHLKSDFQQLCTLNFGQDAAAILQQCMEDNSGNMNKSITETTPKKSQPGTSSASPLIKSPSKSEKKVKKTPKKEDSKKRDKKERQRSQSYHHQNKDAHNSDIILTPTGISVRKVKLEHKNGISLGFCIRGGVDLRTGIFISQIDPGSQAEKKGLKVGERILKVNDTAFKNVTHAEAVVALKSSQKLTLFVAQLGQMPGVTTPTRLEDGQVRSPSNRERNIILVADEDGWLGCSIRGGSDYNMEVTVASIDPLSPAQRAGLKRGQKIVKVNDVDIQGLTHLQIVHLVTASNVVKFLVQLPVGKSKRAISISSPREQENTDVASRVTNNEVQTGNTARRVVRRHSSPPKSLDSQQKGRSSRVRSPSNRADPARPTTPLRAGLSSQQSLTVFEKELQSTPPVSSSTPLPPQDHPALLANRDTMGNMYHSHTVIQHSDRQVIAPTTNQNVSGSSIENDSPVGTATSRTKRTSKAHDEKLLRLEQGTVGRNMDKQMKDGMISAKFSDNNPTTSQSSRVHVKNLFNSSQDKIHPQDDSLEDINFIMFSPKDRGQQHSAASPRLNALSTPNYGLINRSTPSRVTPQYNTPLDEYSNVQDKVMNIPAKQQTHAETMEQLQNLQDVDVDATMGDQDDTINVLSEALRNKTDLNNSSTIRRHPSTCNDNSDWRLW
ncbi:uncharacterized protein LOC144433785 [Glandiceps talaboti]